MRCALVQMTSSDDPKSNARTVSDRIKEAASGGADFVLTPEVSNCLSTSRLHQQSVLRLEADDETLLAARAAARMHGVSVLLGSIAVKTGDKDGRFANRSILIDANGEITARYDKAHMFDVTVSERETYRESAGYRPGSKLVSGSVSGSGAKIGMTVCYDIRFPTLYRRLAQAGAQILTVPSAFSPATGSAHWEVLLRARAIETGCFVLAPAQTGDHPQQAGKGRSTYGHSMAIGPWGDILVDAGTGCGISFVDLDLDEVAQAHERIPSLTHYQELTGP